MEMKAITVPVWTRASLAKAAGVGVETLRFYEQKELLGMPERNASGYRIYDEGDLERLQFISRSQELGFSLSEIKELMELTGNTRTPKAKVREVAGVRLASIREKIKTLRAMEKALGSLVEQCDGTGAIKGCPIIDFIGGKIRTKKQGKCHE